jgi:hypothetical protein
MSEKNKNDFWPPEDEPEPDVIQPIACAYCQHTEMERLRIAVGAVREGDLEKAFLGALTAKRHPLYAWRCMNCGYIMWFTARTLD